MTPELKQRYEVEMRKMERNDEVRFFYFKDQYNYKGTITACAILNAVDGEIDVVAGFAFCGTKDRFVKSEGRLMAYARAIGEMPFKNGVVAYACKRWSGNSQNDVIDIFNSMNPHNIPNPFKKWKLVKYTSIGVDRR